MEGLKRYLIIVVALSLLSGCAATTTVKGSSERASNLALVDISEGLPQDGQWRENIALADMDGDGFLDIVAPPPRKPAEEKNRPHIFLWKQQEKTWKEGTLAFPPLKDYAYGGIAVGDINKDGYPDIVLGVHGGRIILLENDKNNGFVERPFPAKDQFRSRMVAINDINGDGWPDIIAFAEAVFTSQDIERPKGILLGQNKEGRNWDVKIIEGSGSLFGDSMAVGDIKGDGNKAIIVAPLIDNSENMRLVWFGDGRGNFSAYEGNLIGSDMMAFFVRSGDLNGDGKDEVVFKVSGFGENAEATLAAYKWTGSRFEDISKGLEVVKDPIVFDLADIDGDGKKELVVLSAKGIGFYIYTDKGWVERGYYQLPYTAIGAYDLKAGRNRDGSLLIVYNQASKEKAYDRGIRAYLMK